MSFTEDELSSFLTRYSTIGDTIKIDTHLLEDSQVVGHGDLYFPNRSLEFTVFIVTDPCISETISMTEVDDFGGFEIVINYNHIFPVPDTKIYKRVLEVACVRQLIHLAIGEMPSEYKDSSHSTLGLGHFYKQFPAILDYKPELQAFYRNQFIETDNPHTKHAYLNSVATALLHGAVNVREYEVDLQALRFFGADDLCFLHWLTNKNMVNTAVQREIANRTQRLLTQGYNQDVINPEFELKLEIYQ